MSARLKALAARRSELVARAAEQRMTLAVMTSRLLPQDGAGRLLLSVKRVAGRHPVWAAATAALAGLFLFRRRRVALWAGRALVAWRAWHAVQGWLKRGASS